MEDVVFCVLSIAVIFGFLFVPAKIANMIDGEAYPQEITIERKEIETRRECHFFGLNCPEVKVYYINSEETTQGAYVKLDKNKTYICPVAENTKVVKYSECEEK